MKRRVLSQALLAVMAEGGHAAGADIAAGAGEEAPAAAGTAGEDAAAAAAGTAGEGNADAADAADTAAAAAGAAHAESDLVTYLRGQVAEKDEALVALRVELAGAKRELEENAAASSGLLAIAQKSTTNMRVALGLQSIDLAALSPEALLAEHKSLSEQFTKAFAVGGVAAVSPEAAPTARSAPTSAFAERLRKAAAFTK